MKRINIIFAIFLLPLLSMAETKKTVQTTPDHITVYTSGAEVSRQATFNYTSGRTSIVFDSLSPYLNNSSIQARGNGDFIILDVKYRMQQPDPLDASQNQLPKRIRIEIKRLQDSIRLKGYVAKDLQNKLDVLNTEKNLLLNNSLVRGNGGDTIPELKQTMDFFRKKLNNINSEILRLEKAIHPHNTELTRMNARLSKLNTWNQTNNPQPARQSVPQVVINITSKSSGKGSIELSYLVNNAGWNASYDIRANDDEEVNLIYKANVYQNTGRSWKDVKLTLSTMNPNQQYTKPVLPVWYASYQTQNQYQSISSGTHRNRTQNTTTMADLEKAEEPTAESAYQYTQAVSSMLNIEYQVNLDFEIPSDGQYHNLPIQNQNLGAEFTYYAAPKMDTKAYLMACITDWKEMDLLQGQASIFFNGRYTGQTNLNARIASDSLELALGRTNNIIIERKKDKTEEKPQLIGSRITETAGYTISIKNTGKHTIKLKLEDVIPQSTDPKNIVVDLIKKDGADFNEDKSLLSWNLEIPAGQSKSLHYSFAVKYDKNKPINLNL